jgi:NAD(P)-dependent dehydrogenase (short-subunit alcohol dehydrogenase family)
MPLLDRFRLDDKVAVVTGASSGLGVAFAEGLAEAGADLVICARRLERLEETKARVEKRGRRCLAVRADVLVNNAGLGTAVPATRETPEEWLRVIDINLNGAYWMAQACGRVMQPGSSIVNIGSVLGLTSGALPQAAYSASKAAIVGLTRDLAQQWTGRKGIRVNALAPGFFPSEMTAEYPEGYLDKMLWRIPAGRHGDPVELACAAVFLASDAASYITGIVLPVEGGMLTM